MMSTELPPPAFGLDAKAQHLLGCQHGDLGELLGRGVMVHMRVDQVDLAAIADQHFMLQKEVVERMAAAPGDKDYGRLSVMLQWRYEIENLFEVPPEAFEPPPRVDSAVVRMTPRPEPADVDVALLGELVAVAFSQRRKLLRHTLGRWLEARGFGGHFDVQRRAEEVPVAQYVALAQAVASPSTRPEKTAPEGAVRVR